MSDTSQGPGWWQASDGKWYPPEQAPGVQTPPPPVAPTRPTAQPGQPQGGQQPSATMLPDGSPPQKKSNTTRNVLIGVGVVFLLLFGGCAALLFAGGAALDEVVDSANEELESSRSETTRPGDTETGTETESAPVPPVEDSDATCAYIGTGGLGGDRMQVEVSFTNPLGELHDLDLTYALLDGEGGTRFLTESNRFSVAHLGKFPRENEQFRVSLDAGESVPPNIDATAISCTVLGIEEPLDIGGYERASDADTCEVLGIDSSGVIQVELAVTSPYEDTTTVQTWWALQAPGPVRFSADTQTTDLVGGGETFRITPRNGVDKPEWVGDDEITCAVLGFWDHER